MLTTHLGIPITSPNYWVSQCEDCLNDIFKHAFRSATLEEIPLLDKRINCIREAGQVLADVSAFTLDATS